MERCDAYRGGVRRYGKVRQLTGSVTVIMQGDVKGIRNVCQFYGEV